MLRDKVDPKYECSHCRNDAVRDLPEGCPRCPLTYAAGGLYRGWPGSERSPGYDGLHADWLYYFEEGAAELARDEPALRRAFGRVLGAVGEVGDRTSPRWSQELAALVEAYRSERAYVRRELEWAMRPKPKGK